MRKATLGTGYYVEYPEANTWELDNNFVRFHRNRALVAGGEWIGKFICGSVTLEYKTTSDDLIIEVGSLLNTLAYDTALSVQIQVCGDRTCFSQDATITNHRGKTLRSRTHGSATFIEVLDESSSYQIYLAGDNGKVENSEHSEIEQSDTAAIVTIDEQSDAGFVWVYFDGRAGELWNQLDTENGFKVYVGQRCVSGKAVLVRYYDTDGCARLAMGKVLSATTSAKQTDFRDTETEILGVPVRHIDSVGEEISVGFKDVPSGQYLEDIMLSSEVWIDLQDTNNTKVSIVPNTLSMTRDGETKDIVINFSILA